MTQKIDLRFLSFFIIFTFSILFFLPNHLYSAISYYYLHVGSFKAEKNAIQFAQKFQSTGLNSVVRGEKIPNRGFWFRIYLGPFSSRLEAELKSHELKEKGIIDYAGVYKKNAPLSNNQDQKPKMTPTPEDAISMTKPPTPAPPIEKKPSADEPSAAELSIPEKQPPIYRAISYYYLHVGSFKAEKNAIQFAQKFQGTGLNSLVRGEEIPNREFWFRIYLGPFSSRLEAELKSRELKEKGIIDYAGVYKKNAPLSYNQDQKAKKTPTPEDAISMSKPPTPGPSIEKKPSADEPPADELSIPEKQPPIEKKSLAPIALEKKSSADEPPADELSIPEKQPPIEKKSLAPITRGTQRFRSRTSMRVLKRGLGRNIRQKGWSLGVIQPYRKVRTEIIQRKSITSDGTTTTTEEIILGNEEKDDFPTNMNMTALRLRLGITNYLEAFADVGTAYYDEFSDLGFVYGGGLRFNFLEVYSPGFRGFFAAIQGEYLSGSFTEEYKSEKGNQWKQESDWQEVSAKFELGIARSKFISYLGGVYLLYDENTERIQLENFSPTITSFKFQDELEEKINMGVYAGIGISLNPALLINLEGQALNQESISLGIEYHF